MKPIEILLGENVLGRLSFEDHQYIFRYEPSFKSLRLPAISAFPDSEKVYQSPFLFTFFWVRIPPLKRPDVAVAMKKLGIDYMDTWRQVVELGGKILTCPYVLRYADDDFEDRRTNKFSKLP